MSPISASDARRFAVALLFGASLLLLLACGVFALFARDDGARANQNIPSDSSFLRTAFVKPEWEAAEWCAAAALVSGGAACILVRPRS